MSVEGFVVFFYFCCCRVERSKVFPIVSHVVVGPLSYVRDEECVANAIYMLFSGCGGPASGSGGRVAPWTQFEYDCTMGYPGEDGDRQSLCRGFTQLAVICF